jgi:hypothetical protein
VQRIMDLKQAKHWRSQPNLEHRFTYNGFLTCSVCEDQVHTAFARKDYYVCKGRRTNHACATKYMARERLEATLDTLFAEQLTSELFLQGCIGEMETRLAGDESTVRTQRLAGSVESLREKRTRVVDAFFEGVIEREERDRRLARIDRELKDTQDLLLREMPVPSLTVNELVDVFAPVVEWKSWTRDQKRLVLTALVPDIRVANYRVSAIGLDFSSQDSRSPAASTTTAPATASAPPR